MCTIHMISKQIEISLARKLYYFMVPPYIWRFWTGVNRWTLVIAKLAWNQLKLNPFISDQLFFWAINLLALSEIQIDRHFMWTYDIHAIKYQPYNILYMGHIICQITFGSRNCFLIYTGRKKIPWENVFEKMYAVHKIEHFACERFR